MTDNALSGNVSLGLSAVCSLSLLCFMRDDVLTTFKSTIFKGKNAYTQTTMKHQESPVKIITSRVRPKLKKSSTVISLALHSLSVSHTFLDSQFVQER